MIHLNYVSACDRLHWSHSNNCSCNKIRSLSTPGFTGTVRDGTRVWADVGPQITFSATVRHSNPTRGARSLDVDPRLNTRHVKAMKAGQSHQRLAAHSVLQTHGTRDRGGAIVVCDGQQRRRHRYWWYERALSVRCWTSCPVPVVQQRPAVVRPADQPGFVVSERKGRIDVAVPHVGAMETSEIRVRVSRPRSQRAIKRSTAPRSA